VIEFLHARNFQNHRDFTLDLDPHITVVIGPNDSGKTALIRALRWVAFNQPSGDEFLSWGEKEVRISVGTNGHIILRSRGGKGGNFYTLDGKDFKAFGMGVVPEEVGKTINLGPLNFQSQHDAPYLLLSSPGEVSRQLNSVVDLSIIDEMLSLSSTWVRSAKILVGHYQDKLKEAKKIREELAWAKEMDEDLRHVEQLDQQSEECFSRLSTIARLVSEVERLKERHENALAQALDAKKPIQIGEALEKLDTRMDELHRLIAEVEQCQNDALRAQAAAANAKKELDQLMKEGCPLCGSPMATRPREKAK
jgi:exonuclease SbcC